MNQTTAHRIDLTIVEHDFAHADAFDVDREDGVPSSFRPQDRGKLTQWSNGSNSFSTAAVNSHGNQSFTSDAPCVVLATTGALLRLDLEFFSLRHMSPHKLSATANH